MIHHLEITTRHTPEVLERVLRVIRHRGFSVQTLQTQLDEANAQVHLQVTVASTRALPLLTTQLAKLVDVNSVTGLSQVTTEQKLA
ncbi:acetolactate synthase 2 small subunit [Motilimonas pumila]|uniref:Acetolactate synthase 2 small subunit n=1 Tax=Motilimonas pumila TaxID=2303987 RepID=A0A418YHE6_9GAMM|nr:acetolactate synthase 2 small subunit [Motilimonas pumila]RJG49518.1 acetolactate synthase 2 small subunit [Motilimonas pumila]